MTLDTTTALDELEMAAWEMINLDEKVTGKTPLDQSKLQEFFSVDKVVPYLPSLRPFFSHGKIIFLMHTLQLAFGGASVQTNEGNIEVKMCPKKTAQFLHISPKTQGVLRKFFKEQGLFDSKYLRKEGVFLISISPCRFNEFLHRLSRQMRQATNPLITVPNIQVNSEIPASKNAPTIALKVILSQIQPAQTPSNTAPFTQPKDILHTKSHMTSQDWDAFTDDIPWGDANDYEQFL